MDTQIAIMQVQERRQLIGKLNQCSANLKNLEIVLNHVSDNLPIGAESNELRESLEVAMLLVDGMRRQDACPCQTLLDN